MGFPCFFEHEGSDIEKGVCSWRGFHLFPCLEWMFCAAPPHLPLWDLLRSGRSHEFALDPHLCRLGPGLEAPPVCCPEKIYYSRLESSWDLEEYDGIGLSPDPPWLQVWEVFMKHWNNSIYPTGWAQKWCPPPQWFNHWTALSHEGGIMDDLQHFIFDDVESKGSAGCRCRTESCLWGGGWSIPRWKSWGKSIEVFHE